MQLSIFNSSCLGFRRACCRTWEENHWRERVMSNPVCPSLPHECSYATLKTGGSLWTFFLKKMLRKSCSAKGLSKNHIRHADVSVQWATWPMALCFIISYYHIKLYYIIWNHIILNQIYQVYHIISYHIISYLIISYLIISYLIINSIYYVYKLMYVHIYIHICVCFLSYISYYMDNVYVVL